MAPYCRGTRMLDCEHVFICDCLLMLLTSTLFRCRFFPSSVNPVVSKSSAISKLSGLPISPLARIYASRSIGGNTSSEIGAPARGFGNGSMYQPVAGSTPPCRPAAAPCFLAGLGVGVPVVGGSPVSGNGGLATGGGDRGGSWVGAVCWLVGASSTVSNRRRFRGSSGSTELACVHSRARARRSRGSPRSRSSTRLWRAAASVFSTSVLQVLEAARCLLRAASLSSFFGQ
jgi:hypothetical protein